MIRSLQDFVLEAVFIGIYLYMAIFLGSFLCGGIAALIWIDFFIACRAEAARPWKRKFTLADLLPDRSELFA